MMTQATRLIGVLRIMAACGSIALVSLWPASTRADSNSPVAGRIFTIAGALRWTGPADEQGLATSAALQDPAVAAAPDGGYLIAETQGYSVLRVSTSGTVSLAAGRQEFGLPGDGGPATQASLAEPGGVSAMADGGFLVADTDDHSIRRVWPDGHISTVAGNGTSGFSGDGGPASAASLAYPKGVAAMADGGFLIADTDNGRVRRVWPDGHISTVAGNGKHGFVFAGDGGPATLAALSFPEAVAAMPDGGFLIADTVNSRVRRVWPDGHISAVAGNGGDSGRGDGGPATSASIGFVHSVAFLPTGGFLIGGDTGVWRVSPAGIISRIVGVRSGGLAGDGGPVSAANLYGPEDDGGPSVAGLAGGGALIGFGNTVRLIVGPNGTDVLGAAIKPLASVVSRGAYAARIVLTEQAHVVIRLFRSPNGRPVAIAQADRPAGESTVRIRLPRGIQRGVYAIDMRATAGAQTTRAEQYVYLGGSLTTATIHTIDFETIEDELSEDPNAVVDVTRCHQFGPLRVDCAVTGDLNYVWASWLTRQGQLRSRAYDASYVRHAPVFKRNAHWSGPIVLRDLGAAWIPRTGY
ncbi:MAG TPA: hypothetical protein VFH80_14475 [Solirubrobacteraceae bacterium]|nr:hypothetical protein [Solirubrobacteraceae bacterium]